MSQPALRGRDAVDPGPARVLRRIAVGRPANDNRRRGAGSGLLAWLALGLLIAGLALVVFV